MDQVRNGTMVDPDQDSTSIAWFSIRIRFLVEISWMVLALKGKYIKGPRIDSNYNSAYSFRILNAFT